MSACVLTELALRTAMNTMDLNLGQDPARVTESILKTAVNRASELINGNSTNATKESQFQFQQQAIGLAIQGVTLAYQAVSEQLSVLKSKRLAFDKERQSGIATFLIPTNVEEKELSNHMKVIKTFVALTKQAIFPNYFGIQHGVLEDDYKQTFYSVLPLYRMSQQLNHPVASMRPLDKQRTSINLFFDSALPHAIADIDKDFQADSKWTSFWESTIKKKNYLNDLRAPRFIMMSLANLLWNLQHPVDPETGFPVSLDQSIKLCNQSLLMLNKLLNEDADPYINCISTKDIDLLSFVRKVEIHVHGLREAFVEKQLHDLNIDEVTNSAHRSLRIMDINLFKLIYRRENPLTGKLEPDAKAAKDVAYTISYLNKLLKKNIVHSPKILEFLKISADKAKVPESAKFNNPPHTVIDLLIIFCHANKALRKKFYNILEASNTPSGLEMRDTLKNLRKRFIKPIKQDLLRQTGWSQVKHDKLIAEESVKRLMPFITLVVEDFRVDVDGELPKKITDKLDEKALENIVSGKKQVQAINQSAETGEGYYIWTLSPYVHSGSPKEAIDALDALPKFQYRITKMTNLLDSISEIIQNYRSFLQHKEFQAFLIECLKRVKSEYESLDKRIDEIDNYLAGDELLSRSLKDVLGTFTADLNNSLDNFDKAMREFERVVSAPDFTEQEKKVLTTKMNSLHEQVVALFGDDRMFEHLLGPLSVMQERGHYFLPEEIKEVNNNITTLGMLVQRCYDALSYRSKQSHKGEIFQQLLSQFQRQPTFTSAQIKHVVLELARLTSSYSVTGFFHAPYGQTRSAKILIQAIKDHDQNNKLPLAEIIFGNKVNINTLTDEQIIAKLRDLQERQQWSISAQSLKDCTPMPA